MKRDLFVLLTSTNTQSLGSLARAIAKAHRRDHLPVWRQFVVGVH
jgi:hypothetical protein